MRQLRQHVTNFGGGLDTDTPTWLVGEGRIKLSSNYEISIHGGYRDIAGYERFDGRPSPSTAGYLAVFAGTSREIDFPTDPEASPVAVRFLDATTGTDANAIYSHILFHDTGNDGYVVATLKTQAGAVVESNTIMTGWNIETSDGTTWTHTGETVTGAEDIGSADPEKNAKFIAAAANVFRNVIAAVPGSGPVRGGFMLRGVNYAMRDNSDESELHFWRSTPAGWERIEVGQTVKTVYFREGSHTSGSNMTPADGTLTSIMKDSATLTGTELGDITIDVRSGGWGTGNAQGFIRFTTPTSAITNGEAVINADNFIGSVNIVSSTFTLLPGGKVRTDLWNFGGGLRIYGCDGKNRGFQWDGEEFLEVVTNSEPDTPNHVACHQAALFYAFGRALRVSGIDEPLTWSAVTGGGEVDVMADDITNLNIEPGEQGGSALSVMTKRRISILYGTSSAEFQLVDLRREVGGLPDTVQEVVRTCFMDERGIRVLEAVQDFGNFRHNTLSSHIQTHINRVAKLPIAGSTIVRELNQYRIYFETGEALHCTFKYDRLLGIMAIELPMRPNVVWSAEDAEGIERIFIGAKDGFVYEMEKGTSFDGGNIRAYMQMHAGYLGRRRIGRQKRFINCVMQAEGSGYGEVSLNYAVLQQTERGGTVGESENIAQINPPLWDTVIWDLFRWDDAGIGPANVPLAGEGNNINFTLIKDSDHYKPLNIYGIQTFFTDGRLNR